MGCQVIAAASEFLNSWAFICLWSVWPGWAPEVSPPGQPSAPWIPQAGPPRAPRSWCMDAWVCVGSSQFHCWCRLWPPLWDQHRPWWPGRAHQALRRPPRGPGLVATSPGPSVHLCGSHVRRLSSATFEGLSPNRAACWGLCGLVCPGDASDPGMVVLPAGTGHGVVSSTVPGVPIGCVSAGFAWARPPVCRGAGRGGADRPEWFFCRHVARCGSASESAVLVPWGCSHVRGGALKQEVILPVVTPEILNELVYQGPTPTRAVRVSWGNCNRWPQMGAQHPSSPSPGDHTSEVRGSQGWAPCRGSRGGSFPPLSASGGSGRPSLGWWPPPSRLGLRLHVASPVSVPLLLCVL